MDDNLLFECKSPDFSLLELLVPLCLEPPEGGLGLEVCDPPPLTETLLGPSARFAPELFPAAPSPPCRPAPPPEPPGGFPYASPPYRVPDSAILSLRREADKLEPLLARGPHPLTSSVPSPGAEGRDGSRVPGPSSCLGEGSLCPCPCHHPPGEGPHSPDDFAEVSPITSPSGEGSLLPHPHPPGEGSQCPGSWSPRSSPHPHGDGSLCPYPHPHGDWSLCPGVGSRHLPSPRPWVWLLPHTQGESEDPSHLLTDPPKAGPAVACGRADVPRGGGARPPSVAAPGTGGWGGEVGQVGREEAESTQDPSGSEGRGQGSAATPPAPARPRTPRKQPHPQRSPRSGDPHFRGVTVRMERRMEGPGEWGLRITARYSPGLQRRLSRLRCPRLRPSTPSSPASSEAEEAAPGQPPARRCASCDTQKTPLWRDAEDGTPLCNACGIRYKKYRLRCPRCWHIPRKEGKCFVRCVRCGDPLRLLLNVRKGGGS